MPGSVDQPMSRARTGTTLYENGALNQATGGPLRPGGQDLTARLLSLCKLQPGDFVLDVGCGTGGTVAHLLDILSVYPVGIDRSELLLQTGIINDPRLPLVCAWGKSLPIQSARVDTVVAECSLSAMSDLDSTLDEFKRVLRPGGCLALSDVYARDPEGISALRALPFSCGLREALTKDDLFERLQAHGFEISVFEDHSETLKYLAAQMIMSHGSLQEFWSHAEPASNPLDIQIAIGKARLGYYILVAKKK